MEVKMLQRHQNKILELALQQLKEKLLRQGSKLKRKNDDGQKRKIVLLAR